MRKSLGDKRKDLSAEAIAEITRLFSEALDLVQEPEPDARVRVLANRDFGYARLTVERPLRRVWRVDAETLAALPEPLQEALTGFPETSWGTEKAAKAAINTHAPNLDTKSLNLVLKTIAVAESCTAGWVMSQLASVPGTVTPTRSPCSS